MGGVEECTVGGRDGESEEGWHIALQISWVSQLEAR